MRQSINFTTTRNFYVVKRNREHEDEIASKIGREAFRFLKAYISVSDPKTFYLPENVVEEFNPSLNRPYNSIINIKKLNKIEHIDRFICSVNKMLINGGLFLGCCETGKLKKEQLYKKYFSPLNRIVFFLYFLYKRIFPKLPIAKRIYIWLTHGRDNAMSKIELFGRLYYGGFELIAEKEIGLLNYFVVKKVKKPCNNIAPSFYPIIKLNRIGLNGKIIQVYKLRTMHPYSEYLQEYFYQNNLLAKSGKINNDSRVLMLGSFLRRFWIDELPMIINLIKGDIKLFGVRPISVQYYNLYTEDLKELRTKFKPGLVPPYYADLPKNFEEIMSSEKKYLLEYQKKPFITDLKYLSKALYNIIIKGKRSQ